MGSTKLRLLLSVLLAFLAVFITPRDALAVVQSLNGQTGQTQTFQNDTNVIINSLNNIHSLGWFGQLPISRGGTGASSFTAGSILFSNGASISQDNSNLFWDDVNNRLAIGTTSRNSTLHVIGDAHVAPTGGGADVILAEWSSNNTNLDMDWAGLNLWNTDTTDNNYASIWFNTKPAPGVPGSDVIWGAAVQAIFTDHVVSNGKTDLAFKVSNPSGFFEAIRIRSDTNVGIGTPNPNAKLDVAGTIRGNSTMFLGSSTSPGCIVMGDSDGSGVTYVTANDGVLSVSTIKPSICQ
ncbi:hypothetical protein HYT60_00465 [Candidatus Woesebacteria bacterium]|nr:hypothetical protein [Candidatus Woesebacteria bacterium]